MTLLFAIRTPLSPLENHIDQYRYASERLRDIPLAPARQPLPVFHVKPKSYSSDAPFSPGDRPHLPVPAPRLQHRGARRTVKAGSRASPQVRPLHEDREALVSAHARFTNAAGIIPTSGSDAMTSKLSHIMKRQTTLTSAG